MASHNEGGYFVFGCCGDTFRSFLVNPEAGSFDSFPEPVESDWVSVYSDRDTRDIHGYAFLCNLSANFEITRMALFWFMRFFFSGLHTGCCQRVYLYRVNRSAKLQLLEADTSKLNYQENERNETKYLD